MINLEHELEHRSLVKEDVADVVLDGNQDPGEVLNFRVVVAQNLVEIVQDLSLVSEDRVQVDVADGFEQSPVAALEVIELQFADPLGVGFLQHGSLEDEVLIETGVVTLLDFLLFFGRSG